MRNSEQLSNKLVEGEYVMQIQKIGGKLRRERLQGGTGGHEQLREGHGGLGENHNLALVGNGGWR
jgi:hypothetical protein